MASGTAHSSRALLPSTARAVAGLLLMFVVTTTASAAETPGRSDNTFVFRPGVVVDREREAVYLMNSAGGIDAVDLASGTLLWRTRHAAKPLLRHRDRLVAQGISPAGPHILRIALLDIHDIAAVPRFVDVPLPAGVQATVVDAMESSFEAAARAHGGVVVLSWNYAYGRVTGPPPDPDDETALRQARGSVRIDIQSGRFEPIGETTPLPEPDLPDAMVRLKDAQALPERLWRVGDVFVAILRTTHQGQQRVNLKRWDAETGRALEDVILFDGGLSFRSLSADRRHLLASRRDATNSGTWQWAVFSLESGAKVAELRRGSPGARFCLSGSRLIHEISASQRQVGGQVLTEPTKLHAIDLATGTTLWSRPIHETRYRGPYPPYTVR